MENPEIQIYVALLNEGVDVWRPVLARQEGADIFRIISEQPDPDDEQWQFPSGALVRCKQRPFSGGQSGLVAFEKVESPSS